MSASRLTPTEPASKPVAPMSVNRMRFRRSRRRRMSISRALTQERRERLRYSAYCDSMSALVGFAESLWAHD